MGSTFTVGQRTFDLNQTAITLAALDAREAITAGEPWSRAWVLHDNTTVTLTAPQMVAVARAARAKVAALSATAQALRQQINNATTPQQVAAVVWPD